MNKIKTTLLALLLLLCTNLLMAQTKYEHAVLKYIPVLGVSKIIISYANDTKIIDLTKEDKKPDFNESVAQKQLNKMSEDGWEVYNTTNSNLESSFYYLKRRKD